MSNEKFEDSILKSIRDAVGHDPDDKSFDGELTLHINSALLALNEVGVGKTIDVQDETSKWSDFCEDVNLVACRTYVFLKTKILFDPPPPSNIKYMDEALNETLWRLRTKVEDEGKDD